MTEPTPERVSVRGAGSSMVSYRIGGKEYPLKTVRRCNTCMSPFRFEIEKDIVAGRAYAKIQEEIRNLLGEDERPPSLQSMQDHFNNGHMPMEQSSIRTLVEQRAREVGKSIEDSNESLVDGITLARAVVMKTFEGIADGSIAPDVREGLAASKLLAEMGEYDGSSVDQHAYVEAFLVYQELAEKIMGPEAFARFGEALAENPVLNALAARYDGEDAEVVPGEVEEESP